MQAIGKLAKTCPVDFLHLETRLEPLDVRFRKLDASLWIATIAYQQMTAESSYSATTPRHD